MRRLGDFTSWNKKNPAVKCKWGKKNLILKDKQTHTNTHFTSVPVPSLRVVYQIYLSTLVRKTYKGYKSHSPPPAPITHNTQARPLRTKTWGEGGRMGEVAYLALSKKQK